MEIEQVDSYNLMAIAILEHFGNGMPSEEEIAKIEHLLKKNTVQPNRKGNVNISIFT
jgi:hypothetical protein